MKILLNKKEYEIRRVNNREVKQIIEQISKAGVTDEEVKDATENPVNIADNLEGFADAIIVATQKQFTVEDLWDATPEEVMDIIIILFDINKVSVIMGKIEKIKAQLKK